MSIQTIEKYKKYKIIVPVSYDGGKRKVKCETFYGGEKEVRLRESELKRQIKTGTYISNDKITLEELINEWLKLKKNVVVVKTYKAYENYSKNIVKSLGRIKVKDITPYALQDFYLKLKNDTNYSDKTILHHYSILSSVFSLAEKWDLIIKNPHKVVDRPKVAKREMACYSQEDTNELLHVLKNENLKAQALIILALDTGCRRGEITGLTWDDIDFNTNTIVIDKTTQYVAGVGIYEKDTKNESSNRKIVITKTTSRILQKYRKEQLEKQMRLGDKWGTSERIFTTEYGKDMHPNTPSAILKRIIKKYDLKPINFHGLRHTSISLQIANGIQPQIISKRAGHSNLTTTHKIYSHFFQDGYKEVAEKMDNILRLK